MSKYFKHIKAWYDKGFYSKEKMAMLVGKETGITADEYETITGDKYNDDPA